MPRIVESDHALNSDSNSITETRNVVSTVYLYRYDSLGNLVGSEKLVGGSPVLRTHHSYDTDNRLSTQG